MKMLWSALVLPVLASCVVEPEPEEPVPARELVPAPLPENLPDAAERALSPRADGRAEQAALVVDRDRWVASEDTYARVVEDFAAIEGELPAVRFGFGDHSEPLAVHGSFVYGPDDEAVAAANAQALVSVTALAEALGGEMVYGDESGFAAAWPARLQPAFIGEVFSAIDSVQYADPGDEEIQGPRIEFEQFDVDGKNVWLMLNFGGDCPEGCTELEASRVRVDKTGGSLTVDLLGSFSTGEACPDWLAVLAGVCERYAAP